MGGRKNRYGLSGLTCGCHRSDRWPSPVWPVTPGVSPWGHSKRNPFTPLPSLSSIIHHPTTASKPWTPPPSPLFHLSHNPWWFEVSTKEKPQDWKQKDLLRPLFTFPFVFLGFNSSSSLQRYSNLSFARSPHLVQSFEFPLVEHLLRSPRRHSYRSIAFCWTHCEKSQIGFGRLSPVWPVAVTGLTGGACPPQNVFFFLFFNTYLF
jgi:hypothetical protein